MGGLTGEGEEIMEILKQLGFVLMTGTEDIVFTNPDSTYLTQVWVLIEGEGGGLTEYDARYGFCFKDFFKWWEEQSAQESPHCCGRMSNNH